MELQHTGVVPRSCSVATYCLAGCIGAAMSRMLYYRTACEKLCEAETFKDKSTRIIGFFVDRGLGIGQITSGWT